MKRRLLRLVLVVLLPLMVCSCAGRAPKPGGFTDLPPEAVLREWEDVDAIAFVSFHTAVEDTVPTPADLPAAEACEGKYYVTGEGEHVALWLATAGSWVQVAP